MTITLGSTVINDDMYLSGIESAPLVATEQLRTIEGVSVVRTKPLVGGRKLTLGSQNRSGATQGIWCFNTIEEIQALEQLAGSVAFDYRGDAYNVVITGTKFTPLLQFQEEGPYKKFTGSISLIEV